MLWGLIEKTSPETYQGFAFGTTLSLATLIFWMMLNAMKPMIDSSGLLTLARSWARAHLFSKPKQGSNRWLFPKGGMGASLMNSRDVGYLRKAIRGMHYLETFPATTPASRGLMTEKAQKALPLKCGLHHWHISTLSSWKPLIVIKKRMCPHWGCVDGSHPEHQRWFLGYSDVRGIWVWWRCFWV